MGGAHATLGASSAHRWMRCLGSPQLIEHLTRDRRIDPNQTSVYAEEGSAAHAVAEHCLRHGVQPGALKGHVVFRDEEREWQIGSVREPGEGQFAVGDEMVEALELYLDVIEAEMAKRPAAELLIEKRVFPLAGREVDMFGTADVIIVDPIDSIAIVIDLKYGAGVQVDADHNVQIMYYGLGSLRHAAGEHGATAFERVEMIIVQPRGRHADGPVRRFTMPAAELVEWGGTLRSAAEATWPEDAPLVAGDWCRFCPAQVHCKAFSKRIVDVAKVNFADVPHGETSIEERLKLMLPDPENPKQMGQALAFIPLLESWCAEVKTLGLRQAEHGRPPEGWKLVRGRRQNRRWTDEEEVARLLKETKRLPSKKIYERKLLSPARMEKVAGKKFVEEHTEQGEGKLTIAPVSDRREPVPPPLLTAFAGGVTSPVEQATELADWVDSL